MKISNEVKIGITTLATLIAAIVLFSFLKGNNVFKSTVNYYVVYDNVGGLAESSPVEVNGYQVGVVQNIGFLNATSGKLLAVLSVDKNFQLPINTIAEVKPVSIIAGMKVQLIYGEGPGYYSHGDTLKGRLNASIITTLENDIDPILNNLGSVIGRLDSIASSVSLILTPEFIANINAVAKNLESTTSGLNNLVSDNRVKLDTMIGNLTAFSDMLAANSGKIEDIISNAESISDSLAMAELSKTISELKSTLEGTTTLLENLNDGEGSAGQFLTDEDLYNNIDSAIRTLNLLLEDVNNNPKKYVHFSLFGRK